jgi:hypothetical protein
MSNNYNIIFVLYTALLVGCTQNSNRSLNQATVTDTLSVIEKDSYVCNEQKKDTVNQKLLEFNVWNINQNKWLNNTWMISEYGYELKGFNDYSYIEPFTVLNLSSNDNKKIENCWALAIGYKKKPYPLVKEVYLILGYEKNSKEISFSVELEQSHTVTKREFMLKDTVILYKIQNEEALFFEDEAVGVAIDPGGVYLEPNHDIADRFILGKPKYKLIRKN